MTEVLIGRESGVDKPRLAVVEDGNVTYFGKPGSVPKSVSRKHCKVTIRDDGSLGIEDITDNNFMFVNGDDCKSRKNIHSGDRIELGPDHYLLNLDEIIKTLSSKQTWHIAHLEKIYNDYHQFKLDNQIKQSTLGALAALPGVLSMASIGVATFVARARLVMIVIAAVFALAFILIRIRNARKVPLELNKKESEFREKFVCPNPTCGHFLGSLTYKDIIKNRSCPYCKAKYIE